MAGQYNPYAAGAKTYGFGRSYPTSGPVDKLGYRERELRTQARRNAVLRRLQAQMQGKTASANFLRWL